MECREAKEKMFPYLDQELSLQEEETLFQHLALCNECSSEFANAEETHFLLQKVLVPAVPPLDLTERIMAGIPLPAEQYTETPGVGFRIRQMLTGIGQKWKDAISSWQMKTAVVTMGLLAVFVFGGMSHFWQLPTSKKQPPMDIDIAQVDPKDNDDQKPVKDNTPVNSPPTGENGPVADDKKDSAGDKSPGEANTDKEEKNTPVVKTQEDKKPTKVIPKSDTNVIELPKAASRENRVETIQVVSLVESNGQNVSHPVISDDGKYVHYLYDNAGVEEEWQIELKSGAVPEKAQSNIVSGDGAEKEPSSKLPQWLNDMDMIKDAKSKTALWSPDKKQLAVNLNTSGTDNDGLWIAQSDGANIAHVAQEGGGNDLVWAPNQMKVAFTDEMDNLYVLYLRENLLIQVEDPANGLDKIDHLSWIRDGQELIFEGKASDGVRSIYRVSLP